MNMELAEKNFKEFASRRKFRTERDECGDLVIPGRFGGLYIYGEEELGIVLLNKTSAHAKNAILQLLKKSKTGKVLAEGDEELMVRINYKEVRLIQNIIRYVAITRRFRNYSPEERAKRAERMKKAREVRKAKLGW